MTTFPYGEEITVWLEVGDRFGDLTLSGERVIPGCVVQPRALQGSSETVGQRVTTTTSRTLYTPPGSGLTAQHRVRLADGTVWRVDGDPGPWRSPFSGHYSHDQAELERVTG